MLALNRYPHPSLPRKRGREGWGRGPRMCQAQRWSVLPVIGTLLALAAFHAAAAEAPGVLAPPGASSCTGCHAASASVETPVPRLAGQPAPLIAEAMLAFRSGTRPGTIMPRLAKGFSD